MMSSLFSGVFFEWTGVRGGGVLSDVDDDDPVRYTCGGTLRNPTRVLVGCWVTTSNCDCRLLLCCRRLCISLGIRTEGSDFVCGCKNVRSGVGWGTNSYSMLAYFFGACLSIFKQSWRHHEQHCAQQSSCALCCELFISSSSSITFSTHLTNTSF